MRMALLHRSACSGHTPQRQMCTAGARLALVEANTPPPPPPPPNELAKNLPCVPHHCRSHPCLPHLEVERDAEGGAALGVVRLQPRVQLAELLSLVGGHRHVAVGGQALGCPQCRMEAVVVRLLRHQLPAHHCHHRIASPISTPHQAVDPNDGYTMILSMVCQDDHHAFCQGSCQRVLIVEYPAASDMCSFLGRPAHCSPQLI